MSCTSWQESIALEVGGHLASGAAEELRRHLRDCPPCRRLAEEMAAGQEALRRYADRTRTEESLDRIRRGVLERLDRKTAWQIGSTPQDRSAVRQFPSPPPRVLPWVALAASLIAAVSLWQLRHLRPPEELPPIRAPRAAPEEASPAVPSPPSVAAPEPPPVVTEEIPRPSGSLPKAPRPAPRPEATSARQRPPRSLAPSPSLVVIAESEGPPALTSSPSLIVIGESHGKLVPSPSLVVLSIDDPPSAAGTVRLPEPSPIGTPTLRRVSEREHHSIYWLEDPADQLMENEDADTQVL